MAEPQQDCAKAKEVTSMLNYCYKRSKKHNATMLWDKSGQEESCWDGFFWHCRASLNRWMRLKGNRAGVQQSQFCFCSVENSR